MEKEMSETQVISKLAKAIAEIELLN